MSDPAVYLEWLESGFAWLDTNWTEEETWADVRPGLLAQLGIGDAMAADETQPVGRLFAYVDAQEPERQRELMLSPAERTEYAAAYVAQPAPAGEWATEPAAESADEATAETAAEPTWVEGHGWMRYDEARAEWVLVEDQAPATSEPASTDDGVAAPAASEAAPEPGPPVAPPMPSDVEAPEAPVPPVAPPMPSDVEAPVPPMPSDAEAPEAPKAPVPPVAPPMPSDVEAPVPPMPSDAEAPVPPVAPPVPDEASSAAPEESVAPPAAEDAPLDPGAVAARATEEILLPALAAAAEQLPELATLSPEELNELLSEIAAARVAATTAS